MPTTYRAARSLVAALITAAFLQCVYLWPRLPNYMASNFDGSGTPNGWSSKASFVGVYLAILGLIWFTLVIMPGRAIGRTKQLRVPNANYWMAPERRDRAFNTIQAMLAWMGALNVALAFGVANLVFTANLDGTPLSNVFLWLLIGYFVAIFVWLVALYRYFRVAPAKYRADRDNA